MTSAGLAEPPPFRQLTLRQLQQFCLGPNSRERVLQLLQHTSAADLLQQTAAAADAAQAREELAAPRLSTAATTATRQRLEAALSGAAVASDTEARNDPQQLLELLLQAVKRCFSIDELWETTLSQPQLRPLLAAAAESPFAAVRELLAQQLRDIASKGDRGANFLVDSGLQQLLLQLLADSSLSVATPAEHALASLCLSARGAESVLSGCFCQRLAQMCSAGPDEVRLRALGPIVAAAAKSQPFFAAAAAAAGGQLLQQPLLLLDSEDVLLAANACNLIEVLSSSTWGAQFLLQQEVPCKLATKLAAAGDDECVVEQQLLLLCHLARQLPEQAAAMFELKDRALKAVLEEYIKSSDKAQRVVGIRCWAVVSSTPAGAAAAAAAVPSGLDTLVDALLQEDEVAAAAVWAWNFVLQETELAALPKRFTEVIEQKLPPKLLKLVLDRPFAEMREACYKLLKALCCCPEAVKACLASEPFRTLLCSQEVDPQYACVQAKHALIVCLCNSFGTYMEQSLDSGFYSALKERAKGGPFSSSGKAVSTAS